MCILKRLSRKWLFLSIAAILVLTVFAILFFPGRSLPDDCPGTLLQISACSNPHLVALNDFQPTVDISVTNKGAQIHGFVVYMNGGGEQVKVFRTVQSGETDVISVPFEGTAEALSISPLILKDRNVNYCSLRLKTEVRKSCD
jgi:hypothetical protein